MRHIQRTMTATLLALLPVSPAFAEHIDILAYNDNGEINTGYIDVDSGTPQTGIRLFTETFTLIYPGLFAPPRRATSITPATRCCRQVIWASMHSR